ncbi:hypothetical protein NMY22_g17527 [Coprinellus aureogranulatus]|nr:hypothetical protein NMY22_g17527 [Coprinellus aureogranulatus]
MIEPTERKHTFKLLRPPSLPASLPTADQPHGQNEIVVANPILQPTPPNPTLALLLRALHPRIVHTHTHPSRVSASITPFSNPGAPTDTVNRNPKHTPDDWTLAADLAPPERRASAISVVLSGLLFGILIARVLSGVIAEFASWRVVYYFAVSVQSLVLVGAYVLLPSYPAKNQGEGEGGEGRLTYAKILKSMAKYAVTEPVLVQCTLVNLASAAAFANFWVTLTFLLGGGGPSSQHGGGEPPYHYSTLVIGLFGLVGMAGVAFGPVVGYVIDRLVPWYASLTAVLGYLLFQSIQTAAGTKSVGVVVVVCFGLDVFRQMLQVSLTTAAFSISTSARARLNAILILGIFIGQVTGTALGTHLFLEYGFLVNAGFNLGLMGFQLLLLAARGPGVGRYTWFGWAKTRAEWEWRREKAQGLVSPDSAGGDRKPDAPALLPSPLAAGDTPPQPPPPPPTTPAPAPAPAPTPVDTNERPSGSKPGSEPNNRNGLNAEAQTLLGLGMTRCASADWRRRSMSGDMGEGASASEREREDGGEGVEMGVLGGVPRLPERP